MVMDYARQSLPDEIEGILGANCTRFYGVE